MPTAWNDQRTVDKVSPHGTLYASDEAAPRIAVVIPSYKVKASIERVVESIGPWAHSIYCVDDCCPNGSGDFIEANVTDPRVTVVRREQNGGVGAATMSGYQAAIADGADILVKIDGDGQMDPRLVPDLVQPIVIHQADYVKGNRFFSGRTIDAMPGLRLFGNAGLSFMTKLSTGYWDLFDPTNGFTALAADVAAELPFEQIHTRYFFESDMLFHLAILRARVMEMPQIAVYEDEESNLSELDALKTFPVLHARNFFRRLFFNYFVRNFSPASVSLLAGAMLTTFGLLFGAMRWFWVAQEGEASTSGTVMLAALPILLGVQLLLSFLQHDIAMTPKEPIHTRLSSIRVRDPNA